LQTYYTPLSDRWPSTGLTLRQAQGAPFGPVWGGDRAASSGTDSPPRHRWDVQRSAAGGAEHVEPHRFVREVEPGADAAQAEIGNARAAEEGAVNLAGG